MSKPTSSAGRNDSLKRLAEAKAYLERRLQKLRQESENIRELLGVVDSALSEKSFRKVELPKAIPAPVEATPAPTLATAPAVTPPLHMFKQIVPIKTEEGVHLADMGEGEEELVVTPAQGKTVDASIPPFKSFLVNRVLEAMKNRDEEEVKVGRLSPDRVLSYTIEQEGSLVKRLIIRKYGEGRRQELLNTIRWTLRRMHARALRDGRPAEGDTATR